jgi:hypothetical protein
MRKAIVAGWIGADDERLTAAGETRLTKMGGE